MNLTDSVSAMAISPQRSVRSDKVRVLTSGKAGKILPIAYMPMLREDRVSRGRIRVNFEMAETVKTLMNSINVTVFAHFVPYLAFERFNGLDQLNRSYKGIPETDGGDVIPFINHRNFYTDNQVFNSLGVHAKSGEPINWSPIEAYNCIVNHRLAKRSSKLDVRGENQHLLAPAFWKGNDQTSIVPDFDQAALDGEVILNFADTGLNIKAQTLPGHTDMTPGHHDVVIGADSNLYFHQSENVAANIVAELNAQGIALSLSNIELAKKTAYFAQLRKRYKNLDDDYIIDLLMDAIRVPDAQMAQPVLLDRKSTIFGYSRRYASDYANIEQSVTTGATSVDIDFRTPAMNTGGIIMITAEIVPEQLVERRKDYFLSAATVDDFPSYLRDEADPEKVTVVQNDHMDVEHSNPVGTFGYAPLNFQWKRDHARIGGKFIRRMNDPYVEDRQRFWAVETIDPQLTDDFYLTNEVPHEVFKDTVSDPFEISAIGSVEIVGLTVFGKGLQENAEDYSAVMDAVDTDRIDQEQE
jgi:hypothetical protein